jgi:acetylornithine deacetylase or succinyl-diaminopimelate desuccinylase
MRDQIERALADVSEREIVELVSRMISIPSHADAPGAERELASFIAAFFEKAGIGSFVGEAAPGRPNVIARIPGSGGGRSLLLCGHLDTVPPYAMQEPYVARVKDGRLYGRGAADMKASLACMMLAMKAVKSSGARLAGDLVFAGLCDEENRSIGASSLARSVDGRKLADGAIVGKPTNLAVCIGHRGLECFEIELRGRSVHAGRDERGVSAVSAASRLVMKLDGKLRPRLSSRKHELFGSASINVGRIEGGTQPSTVPGECRVLVDRRWLPSESYESMVGEIESLLRELERTTPGLSASLRVMDESVMEGGMVHAPFETDRSHPLVQACLSAVATIAPRLSTRRSIAAFPAWSDAAVLANYAATPSVVWGPGFLESAHSDEENIELAQLHPAVRGYALAANEFCS